MDYDDDDYVYPQQPMQYPPPMQPPPQQQQQQLYNPVRPAMTTATAIPPSGSGNVYSTSTPANTFNNNNNNNNNNNTSYAGAGQPLNSIPTNQNLVLGGKGGSGGYFSQTSPNVSTSYGGAPAAAPAARGFGGGGSNSHLNISQSSWQTASTSRVATPSMQQPTTPLMQQPVLPSYQFEHQSGSSQPNSLFRFDSSPNRAGTPSQVASGSRRESLPQTPTLNSSADMRQQQQQQQQYASASGSAFGLRPAVAPSFAGGVSTPPQLLLNPKLSPARSSPAPSQPQQHTHTSSSVRSTPSRPAMGMPYQTPLRPIRPRGNAHGIVLRHQVAADPLPQPKPVVLPANGPALRPLLLLQPAVQNKLRDITPSPFNYFDDVVHQVMLSMQNWIDESGGEVRFFTFHPTKDEISFVCVTGMYLRALQRIVGNNMDRCMASLRNGLVCFSDVKQPIVAMEVVQTVCGAQYTPVFSCSVNEVCILDVALGVAPPYFFINSRLS